MKTKMIVAFLAICFLVDVVVAEDLNTILQRVNKYSAEENYSKALEELSWARKEIEKLHVKKLVSLIPDQLAGYVAEPTKTDGALGFTSIERVYKQGNANMQLNITVGTGSVNRQMGGLAGLGRMAAMMGGGAPGSETIRIDGLTASVEARGSNNTITVFLNSGSILELRGNQTSVDTLKEAVKSLNLSKLDSYLAGLK